MNTRSSRQSGSPLEKSIEADSSRRVRSLPRSTGKTGEIHSPPPLVAETKFSLDESRAVCKPQFYEFHT